MGGFWNTLGQVGQGMLAGAAQRNGIANGIYNRYKPGQDHTQENLGDFQGPPPIDTTGTDAIDQANSAAGLSDLSKPGAGQDASMSGMPDATQSAAMSQWNQPDTSGGNAITKGLALMGAAQGAVVTKPTLARIGERGPEAVVPLTPRPGNKVGPDLLEGHVTAPKPPGIHYSRYKSYNRLGPNAGGAIV